MNDNVIFAMVLIFVSAIIGIAIIFKKREEQENSVDIIEAVGNTAGTNGCLITAENGSRIKILPPQPAPVAAHTAAQPQQPITVNVTVNGVTAQNAGEVAGT